MTTYKQAKLAMILAQQLNRGLDMVELMNATIKGADGLIKLLLSDIKKARGVTAPS